MLSDLDQTHKSVLLKRKRRFTFLPTYFASLCISWLASVSFGRSCVCRLEASQMGYPYEEGLVICRLLMFCTLSSVPGLLPVILLSAVNDPPVLCSEGLMLGPNVGQCSRADLLTSSRFILVAIDYQWHNEVLAGAYCLAVRLTVGMKKVVRFCMCCFVLFFNKNVDLASYHGCIFQFLPSQVSWSSSTISSRISLSMLSWRQMSSRA